MDQHFLGMSVGALPGLAKTGDFYVEEEKEGG
jgi:hypothetical protein